MRLALVSAQDLQNALMLRTASPATYDAWVRGELPFDSPEVRRAFGLMENLWPNDDYVHGGTANIVKTSVFGAGGPMFADPPGCYLLEGASWSPITFPEEAIYSEDYDFFLFPAIDPQYGQPLLGGGELYSMFIDRPEVREVMRYLTTGESFKPFADSGDFVSSHRDVPLEWFTTSRQLSYEQIISSTKIYRFDGSDLMPGEVGFQFWQGIIDWLEEEDLDTILQEIDASWPR